MIGDGYFYLAANLAAVPLLLAAWLMAGPQRKAMLASGACFLPWAVGAPLFDDYWSPARWGGFSPGIEDLLYCFMSGMSVWFWGSMPMRGSLVTDLTPLRIAPRLAVVAAAVVLGFGLFGTVLGASPMMQASLVSASAITVLLTKFPWCWPIALSAGLGYGITYMLFLHALFALWPDFEAVWSENHAWTTPFLGLPKGELVVAFLGGAAQALIFSFVVQVKRVPVMRPPTSEPGRN
jgi:hypothetical protein